MPPAAASDASVRVIKSVDEIARGDWDACANPIDLPYNPFISHDFFAALEKSGSTSPKTGWLAQHLVLDGADGRPAAILPAFLKSHSMGEYVFDQGWADAYERAGGRYYPKLQVAVPFTPVPGRRLLVRPGVDADRNRTLAAGAVIALASKHRASSAHITFATEDEWKLLGENEYLLRTDQQFHFVNEGFRTFDDFLAALTARKRKVVKRERRDALAGGIEVDRLTGSDLTEKVWDAFFAFYMDTGSRKWGRPYLNRKFFSLIGESMADRILLVIARRGTRTIAGALNFIGSDTLYGRHWGAVEEQPFLHFELCYYQAMEWAIDHGLAKVEAGAQGEHKLARGYRPTTTYSAHWIADPGFRRAVADYLVRERRQVASDSEALLEFMPFRRERSMDPAD
ncbi:MAG: GNAT family N-acetyltransferase [Bauldia sp.]